MKTKLLALIFLFLPFYAFCEDYWNPTNGPYGGSISTMDVCDNGRIIAGMPGGLVLSENDGKKWEAWDFQGHRIYQVNVIDKDVYVCRVDGLYRSVDNGDNWSRRDGGIINNASFKFCNVDSDGTIFVIAHIAHEYNKFYRSEDDGQSWDMIQESIGLIQSMEMDETNDYIYLGAFKNGIHRTTDGGSNIEKVGLDTLTVKSITVDASGNVYAGTNQNGLFRSTDEGETWTDMNLGSYGIHTVLVDQNDNIYVGTRDNGVFFSSDDGSTWNQMNSGLFNLSIYSFVEADNGNILCSSYGDGVYVYDNDSQKWEKSSNGMKFTGIHKVMALDPDNVFATTKGSGVQYSDNRGASWTSLNNGITSPSIVDIGVSQSGVLYAAGSRGKVYKSTNKGQNWQIIRTPSQNEMVTSLGVSPGGHVYIKSNNNGLRKTTDDGNSWQNLGYDDFTIKDMHFDSDETIYSAVYDDGIYISTDGGGSFTQVSEGSYLCISADSSGNYFAGDFSGSIDKSSDGGESFNQVTSCFTSVDAIAANSSGYIFATARNWGVKISTDNGSAWETVNSGIDNLWIYDVTTANDTLTFLATDEGVYASLPKPIELDAVSLISPANDTFNVNTNPPLIWNSVDKALNYQVVIAKDTDFDDIIETATVEDTLYQIQKKLEYGTKYYWKVKAIRSIFHGPFPDRWHFTTNLKSPELTSPENYSEMTPLTLTFEWNEVDKGDEYSIQISTSDDFKDIFIDKDGLTSTNISVDLFPLTTYYWRVKAVSGRMQSDWSDSWELSTAAPLVNLIAPENNSQRNKPDVRFVWNSVITATDYVIEASATEEFFGGNLIFSQSSNADTTFEYSFDFDQQVFWRVKAIFGDKESDWSEVHTFRTGIRPPDLMAPEKNSSNISITPHLLWESMSEADSYCVEISKNADFHNIEFTRNGITENTVISDKLQGESTYYWRAKAAIGQDTTLWSEIWSFTTGITPPSLRYPENGAQSMPVSIEFKWSEYSGAVEYTIEIASDPAFDEIHISEVVTDNKLMVPDLERFQKYYWRLKAEIPKGVSLWSEIWEFETGLNPPVLKEPVFNEKNLPLDLVFTWEPVIGAEYYELQIASEYSFDNPYHVADNIYSSQFQISNLEYSTWYRWRVKAKSEAGESKWSEVFSFKTRMPNSVSNSEIIEKYGANVYPNPASGVANIDFLMPAAGNLSVFITNPVGRILDRLADSEYRPKGKCRLAWNPGHNPSGLYFANIILPGGKKFAIKFLIINN
jgi:photosystem II stability/assembly factor-like uncharacterized protein